MNVNRLLATFQECPGGCGTLTRDFEYCRSCMRLMGEYAAFDLAAEEAERRAIQERIAGDAVSGVAAQPEAEIEPEVKPEPEPDPRRVHPRTPAEMVQHAAVQAGLRNPDLRKPDLRRAEMGLVDLPLTGLRGMGLVFWAGLIGFGLVLVIF